MATPALVSFLMRHPRLLVLVNRYINWRNEWRKRNHECLWRVYRDGGGGVLTTPRPMTQEGAVSWVNRVTGGEVFHVDFEHRMIFYRSAGQMRLTD